MSIEDSVAFFFVVCLQFVVERSKVGVSSCHVVVGPLALTCVEECVSKVNSDLFSGGGALVLRTGGRTTLTKSKLFDSTMGYPGEDGHMQLLF